MRKIEAVESMARIEFTATADRASNSGSVRAIEISP
jgi:hypothetical protein